MQRTAVSRSSPVKLGGRVKFALNPLKNAKTTNRRRWPESYRVLHNVDFHPTLSEFMRDVILLAMNRKSGKRTDTLGLYNALKKLGID